MKLTVGDVIGYGRQHTNGLHMPITIKGMEIKKTTLEDGEIVIYPVTKSIPVICMDCDWSGSEDEVKRGLKDRFCPECGSSYIVDDLA